MVNGARDEACRILDSVRVRVRVRIRVRQGMRHTAFWKGSQLVRRRHTVAATGGLGSGLGIGLEEVFVIHSKSENRDRAVETAEAVSEARAV